MKNKIIIYFLILILILILLKKVFKTKEKFTESINVSQDADFILKNLSSRDSIKLLVSNNFLFPWVKNMEENEAEEIYNRLFVNEENEYLSLSKILYGYTDENGNVITDKASGIDLDISKSEHLKNKSDIYEYNELVKFIEESTFEEIKEWGEKIGFKLILDENENVTSVFNPSLKNINEIGEIDLNLAVKRKTINVNGKKYTFTLPSMNSEKYNLSELKNKDYNLEFPNTLPSELKYRIRSNKSRVLNALSNIINSYGIKQGLHWKKTIRNGVVLSNKTIGPNTILNIKKSKLIRLKNLNISNIARPKKVLSMCTDTDDIYKIYNNLLKVNNKSYDSNESYFPKKIINHKNQVLVDDKTEDSKVLKKFMKIFNIENIYNTIEGNLVKSNFYKSENDILGFPWSFKDPEPFEWDVSKESAMNKSILQLKRLFLNKEKKLVELTDKEKNDILRPGQIIFGPNNIILCRIEEEIIYNELTNEILEENIIYLDSHGNKYSLPNIEESIAWKLNDLKLMFEKDDELIYKRQVALINKLIVIRAKSIKNKKERSISHLKEYKNSVSNVLKITLNDDKKEQCILNKLSDLLSEYSLIQKPNNPIYEAKDIKVMNRKNFTSILENGVQELERNLIYNICIERESYPNGSIHLDLKGNKINFISREDVLRLQKALYSSFNGAISIEDNLDDLVYGTIRMKILLKNKRDNNGNFLLKEINNNIEKELISSIVQKINKVSFKDIEMNENYKNNVLKKTIEVGLTIEDISRIYQYVSLDEYLSVPLDLINNHQYFKEIFNKINKNDISDKEKNRAINAIKSLKNRTLSMLDEKKVIILDQIKSNIIKRHLINNEDNDNFIKEFILNNISMDTTFLSIKNFTFNNIRVAQENFNNATKYSIFS